jgi:hypothetical protein
VKYSGHSLRDGCSLLCFDGDGSILSTSCDLVRVPNAPGTLNILFIIRIYLVAFRLLLYLADASLTLLDVGDSIPLSVFEVISLIEDLNTSNR